MALTYAGVFLCPPTAEEASWIEASISPQDIYCAYADARTWPGKNRTAWPWAAYCPLPRIRPGVLSWPWGASRFAAGWYLADDTQLTAIRKAVYGTAGTSYTSQPLVLDDGRTGKKITTNLWLLPPRPLAQISGKNGLYLLPLVDDRYWWWEVAASVVVTAGTTTWAGLISAIATALGVTITTDSISSSYLKPPADLTARYEYLPLLIDAVLMCIGHRLVRKLDGTLVTQAPLTAKASQDAQVTTYTKIAGGTFLFVPPSSAGPTHDLNALVPASVTTVFPRQDSGIPNVAPYTVSTTLASLSLAEFKNVTAHSGSKFIRDTATAYYISAVLQNGTELANLATQIATSYYLWALARMDTVFIGIVPWTPEGYDLVDWTWFEGNVSTRVQRGPWDDRVEDLLHLGATYGSQETCCPGISTATDTSGNQTTTLSQAVYIAPGTTGEKPLQILPPSGSTQDIITVYKPGDTTTNLYKETYQGIITATTQDATTNSATAVYTFQHNTTGTPTTNYGTTLLVQQQSSTTVNRPVFDLTSIWTTATDASRQSRLTVNVYNNTGTPIPAWVTQTDTSNNAITAIGGSLPVTAETVAITAQTGGYTPLTVVAGSSPTVPAFNVTNNLGVTEVEIDKNFKTILAAATTAAASLNIPSGTAPSSPVAGDVWFNGTDLEFYNGSSTISLTSPPPPSAQTVSKGATLTLYGVRLWYKCALAYTDFSSGASPVTITVAVLPAKGCSWSAQATCTQAFAGTGISTVTFSAGITGQSALYVSSENVTSTGSSPLHIETNASNVQPSTSGTTNLTATLSTSAGVPNALTQGAITLEWECNTP